MNAAMKSKTMAAFVLLSTALVIDSALGATGGSGLKSCPIKAGTGPYSYDPLSGKGPEDWGSLKGYQKCGNGKAQSPIDFPTDVSYSSFSSAPKPMMKGATFSFSSGAENWALNCAKPGTCGYTMYNGVRFDVVNLHFHAPAEHTLNGTQYPLCAHVVHASKAGALAVIIVHFDYVKEDSYEAAIKMMKNNKPNEINVNPLIRQVLNGVSNNRSQFKVNIGVAFNPRGGICSYTGSLTTPPCTEGVTFFLQLDVQPVSRQQVHAYKVSAGASLYGNARPIQPLNRRKITCYV